MTKGIGAALTPIAASDPTLGGASHGDGVARVLLRRPARPPVADHVGNVGASPETLQHDHECRFMTSSQGACQRGRRDDRRGCVLTPSIFAAGGISCRSWLSPEADSLFTAGHGKRGTIVPSVFTPHFCRGVQDGCAAVSGLVSQPDLSQKEASHVVLLGPSFERLRCG